MTVRDVDLEYAYDDPEGGWFGHAVAIDPEPEPDPGDMRAVVGADDIPADEAVTDSWYMPVADPRSVEFDEPIANEPIATRLDHRPAGPRASREARLSTSDAWDFKTPSASVPWYRSTSAVVAAAVIAAAVAAAGIAVLVRSPAPAVDDSTTVAPPRDSSPPAPTNPAPALSSQAPAPVPPPGLPPPPPPAAQEISPPVVGRQYSPSHQTPDAPKKPQLNVTRAPMSATPPPPPKPGRNSATPGDAPRHRGFF